VLVAADYVIQAKSSSDFSVGFSKEPITPLGDPSKDTYYLAGYDKGRRDLSIHDDIWARTIIIEKSGKRLAVVTLDVVGFFNNYIEEIRELLPESLEIDYLIVNSTHNHEAPDTMGLWGPGANSGVRRDYLEFIYAKVVKSITQGVDNLKRSRIEIAQTSTKDMGLMIDTRSPQVLPHTLTALRFVDTDSGDTLGTIAHWHCHVEALGPDNTAITSDYAHTLRKELEAHHKGATSILWIGTVGGLMAPPPTFSHEGKTYSQGTFEYSEVMGRRLGERAVSALKEDAQVLDPYRLNVVREVVLHKVDNASFKAASAMGIIPRDFIENDYLKTETAAVQIGDLTILTLPGELYPELAFGPLDPPNGADDPHATKELPVLNAAIPGRFKLLLGLAQDEIGYLIPANGWDEEEPYIDDARDNSYGEEVSTGVTAAAQVHASAMRVLNRL
jgi:hypothetical protein